MDQFNWRYVRVIRQEGIGFVERLNGDGTPVHFALTEKPIADPKTDTDIILKTTDGTDGAKTTQWTMRCDRDKREGWLQRLKQIAPDTSDRARSLRGFRR